MGGERAKPKGGSWAVPPGIALCGFALVPLVAYFVGPAAAFLVALILGGAFLSAGYKQDAPHWLRALSLWLTKPAVQAFKAWHARRVTRGLAEFENWSDARRWRLARTVDRRLPPSRVFQFLHSILICFGLSFALKASRWGGQAISAELVAIPGVRASELVLSTLTTVLLSVIALGLLFALVTQVNTLDWRRRLISLREGHGLPRCGGCQYPLAGIPLVNNAVTCPECGDLNRFWPGSKPHAAMVEAMGQPPLPTTPDPGPADEARRASDRS